MARLAVPKIAAARGIENPHEIGWGRGRRGREREREREATREG